MLKWCYLLIRKKFKGGTFGVCESRVFTFVCLSFFDHWDWDDAWKPHAENRFSEKKNEWILENNLGI